MHGTMPGPHQEIEIKLELGPANLPDLKKIPFLRTVKPTPRGAPQVSVYFDTNSQKLRKKGLMLRVRREGRHYTQTIKATTNGEQFERDEWEAEIAGNKPDLDQANGTALEPLLTRKLRRRDSRWPARIAGQSRFHRPAHRHERARGVQDNRSRLPETGDQ